MGETLPWQGTERRGLLSRLSLLLGLWQVIFHLAIYNKEPFFEFYMLQCSCLENSIFINSIAFIGHTKG